MSKSADKDNEGLRLKTGFQTLKSIVLKKIRLINDDLFDALARAIALWGNPAFADLLINEFSYITADENDDDFIDDGLSRHYELNNGDIPVMIS